jgi:hypothetical protein
MIHSSQKALIKKDSANCICQADHKNFKVDRVHHTLLQHLKEVQEEDAVVTSTPSESARPLPMLTSPAPSGRPEDKKAN